MKSKHLVAPVAALALSGFAAAPAFAQPASGTDLGTTSCPTSIDLSESEFCFSLGGEFLTGDSISAADFADPEKGAALSVYGLNTYSAEEGEAERIAYSVVSAETEEVLLSGEARGSQLGLVSGVTLSAETNDPEELAALPGEYRVTVVAEGRKALTAALTVTPSEEPAQEDPEEREAPEDGDAERGGAGEEPEADASEAAEQQDDAAEEAQDPAESEAREDTGADRRTEAEDGEPSAEGEDPARTDDEGPAAVPVEEAGFGFAASRTEATAEQLGAQGLSFTLYGLEPGSLIRISGLPGAQAPTTGYANELGLGQLTWQQPSWAQAAEADAYEYTVIATPLGASAAVVAETALTVTGEAGVARTASTGDAGTRDTEGDGAEAAGSEDAPAENPTGQDAETAWASGAEQTPTSDSPSGPRAEDLPATGGAEGSHAQEADASAQDAGAGTVTVPGLSGQGRFEDEPAAEDSASEASAGAPAASPPASEDELPTPIDTVATANANELTALSTAGLAAGAVLLTVGTATVVLRRRHRSAW
ncbi:hypothetical protein [Brevibacterium album]|uniref:hypothetical protein n=1 Tax=Brevibacterium album TaxID=417948 RepID=UPI00040F3B0C|nr:hypothetical protein [Brevibacterium album]